MIVYFSGTGNSFYVAQALGKALGEQVCDIRRFSTCDGVGRRIVWVFPIHSWGMPKLVVKFIKSLTLQPGIPNFMVCTCGDDIGLAHRQWRKAIRQSGGKPVATFSVIMPNTYTLLPGFDVDSRELQSRKLNATPQRIREIARCIENGREVDDVTPGAMPWLKTRIVYPLFKRFMHSARPFHADEACTKCGKCEASCPTGNIKLDKNGHPEWGHNCTMCLACYHRCPARAINYGKATLKKGHYRCPPLYLSKDFISSMFSTAD